MDPYKGLKLKKTTFEEAEREQNEYFLSLTPFQRWEITLSNREHWKKRGINYEWKGQRVRVIRNGASQ